METPNGLDDCIIELLHLQKFTKRANLREQLTSRGFYIPDRQLRKTIERLADSNAGRFGRGPAPTESKGRSVDYSRELSATELLGRQTYTTA